ncbi:hypothetical protein KKHLCK_03345 [Candidatus Electrothrix laxa]
MASRPLCSLASRFAVNSSLTRRSCEGVLPGLISMPLTPHIGRLLVGCNKVSGEKLCCPILFAKPENGFDTPVSVR